MDMYLLLQMYVFKNVLFKLNILSKKKYLLLFYYFTFCQHIFLLRILLKIMFLNFLFKKKKRDYKISIIFYQ